jgi:hypothetical protein
MVIHRLHAKALERQRHRQTETETTNLSGVSGCEQSVDSSLYLRLVANHRPHHLTTLLLFSPPSSPSLGEGSLFLQSQTHKDAYSIWLLRTASVFLFKKNQLSSCCAHLLHICSSQTSSPHQILVYKNPKTQLSCAPQSETNFSLSLQQTRICKMLDSSQTKSIPKNRIFVMTKQHQQFLLAASIRLDFFSSSSFFKP